MFTVVIPLYNKAHTICSTLNTVLQQTFKSFEIVVVNDGSTDNSVKVIQKHTSDKRLNIINQENQGVSAARNTGVANAKYDYIAFLDGDDEWLPTYLEKMNEAILKFPEDRYFCSAGMSKSIKGYGSKRQIKKNEGQILKITFFQNPHIFLHISAVVIRKDLFHKVKGFPVGMIRNEDYTFLHKAALHSPPIYSGFPLSVYVSDVVGQATTKTIYESEKLLEDTVSRFNLVFETFVDLGRKDKYYITFTKYELRHFFKMNTNKNKFEINAYFLENLDSRMLKYFSNIELLMIKKSNKISKILIVYINLTKLLWKLRLKINQ